MYNIWINNVMLKINNTNSNLSISLKQIKTNKELKRQNDWIYIY